MSSSAIAHLLRVTPAHSNSAAVIRPLSTRIIDFLAIPVTSTSWRPRLSVAAAASRSAAANAHRCKSTHAPRSRPTRSTSLSGGPTSRISPTYTVHPRPPPASHFAPQPPPHHGGPRLIRYPSPSEGSIPADNAATTASATDASSLSSLYSYSRGPTSRLFSFHNSAALTSTNSAVRNPRGIYSSYLPAIVSDRLPVPSQLDADQTLPVTHENMVTEVQASPNASEVRRRGRGTARDAAEVQEHDHTHEHEHSHAHGWFGHSHSHSHAAEGSAEEADKLIDALKGKGDRGSNITVIGLIANLVLCGAKGVAGVFLHSAALLADAAHSLSDTFSDLVTLFCWKMSQRPASQSHPLGYGKFETMGGLGVSVVLVGGALAIGMHSYGLLLDVLQPHLQQMPSGLQALGSFTGDIAKAAGGLLHDHHHTAGGDAAGAVLDAAHGAKQQLGSAATSAESANLLDPNAMWFALISIIVKEWLYHATLKIAREEKSSVLEANAIHHRSDSLSSGVTFVAIAGSYFGFPVLDPLGGLLVAGLIGKQGIELLIGALADLSDRGVQPEVLDDFEKALQEVIDRTEGGSATGPAAAAGKRSSSRARNGINGSDEQEQDGEKEEAAARLLGWKDLRAVRSGVSTFVDVTLIMSEEVRLKNARLVESEVREKLIAAHKGVKEVRIHLDTQN